MEIDLEKTKQIQSIAMLNALQTDINNLKLGLSHVLSKEFSAALLLRMESFYTVLLNHEATIAVLRHELSIQTANTEAHNIELPPLLQPDPANDIKVVGEQIEKLKVQLAKYSTAFIKSAI